MGMWQKTLFYLGLVDEDQAEGVSRSPQRAPDPGSAQPYGGSIEDTGTGRIVRPTLPTTQVSGRRVEPPLTARRRVSPDAALADAGVIVTPSDHPMVRTVSDSDLESEVITARSYSDAQLLADHIRSNVPVVLDLRNVEPAMVRRLVDFASGLTYALGGTMRKVAQGVVLVTPANVNISRDERRRLRDLGYYEAPEGG